MDQERLDHLKKLRDQAKEQLDLALAQGPAADPKVEVEAEAALRQFLKEMLQEPEVRSDLQEKVKQMSENQKATE